MTEPDCKRLRASPPEPRAQAPLNVRSLATWDLLTPLCEELRGRMVVGSAGAVRLLSPRGVQEPDEEQSEEGKEGGEGEHCELGLHKQMTKVWRTREAWQLLALVAHYDIKVFRMLLRHTSGLQVGRGLEAKEGDDDEEEQGNSGEHTEDTYKFECKRDQDEFILSQLELAFLVGDLENSEPSFVEALKWMFLGRSIGCEPSAACLQTKARILEMPFPIRPPIPRSIEILVSIFLGR